MTATAIISPRPPAGSGGSVELKAVALSPEAVARGGARAWRMRLAVDCHETRIRQGPTLGYADPAGLDDGAELRPGDADWTTPSFGTTLYAAWRAVCDPAFQPPLAPSQVAAISQPSTPNAPAAASEAVAIAPQATPRPAPQRGPNAAQVVSSPAAKDSERTLAQLRQRFPQAFAGRDTQVQRAQVSGRTVYRGLVVGFASRSQAQDFCGALKARGQDCLAR
jgi:hypothetical protein